MPIITGFELTKYTDGALKIALTPPVEVGGWGVEFDLAKRFGASSSGILVKRSAASGYGGGQSGITVTDSGQGVFLIDAPKPSEMSGMNEGVYAAQFARTDSGFQTTMTQAFYLAGTNIRQ